MPLLVWVIRLTLYTKKYIFPWTVCAATTAILLQDTLSAKNVLLNFMAMSFFLQADDMLALLLLSDENHKFIKRVQQTNVRHQVKIAQTSYLSSRFVAVAASFLCVFSIMFYKQIDDQLYQSSINCTVSISFLFQHISPNLNIFFCAIGHLDEMKWKGLFNAADKAN